MAAKSYEFRFVAHKAEFTAGTMIYAPFDEPLGTEDKALPLKDAEAYLVEFAAKHQAPCHTYFIMRYKNDRNPPGFKTARKTCDRTE